jgi:hypothetical protein
VAQFDVEAALRRHVAIPQTRDRRYNPKLTHYHRRTVCQKLAASESVLLNGEGTGKEKPEVCSQKSVVSTQKKRPRPQQAWPPTCWAAFARHA